MTDSFGYGWRLDGRVAFVTGAGGGLGRAISNLLAEAGAAVICADLAKDAAEETAAQVSASGGSARAVALDVTNRDQVEAAVGSLDRLDVMCNLAGIAGKAEPVTEIKEESFDRMFAVHFKGVLYGCQAAIKAMTPSSRGSIINMSSAAIDLAPPTVASYAVAKASVSMLTRVLAAEVGRHGIRVNALAPGFVPTALALENHPNEEEGRAYIDWWARKSPLKRVGTPDDIAAQALYLAADVSSFVTGQTLRANGGVTMPW